MNNIKNGGSSWFIQRLWAIWTKSLKKTNEIWGSLLSHIDAITYMLHISHNSIIIAFPYSSKWKLSMLLQSVQKSHLITWFCWKIFWIAFRYVSSYYLHQNTLLFSCVNYDKRYPTKKMISEKWSYQMNIMKEKQHKYVVMYSSNINRQSKRPKT